MEIGERTQLVVRNVEVVRKQEHVFVHHQSLEENPVIALPVKQHHVIQMRVQVGINHSIFAVEV